MIQKFYKVLALVLLAFGPFLVQAQSTTITTDPNFSGGTFFAAPAQIAFVVENTNAGGILITGIDHYCQTTENNSVWELYYSSTSISGTSTVPSADWTLIATSLPTPVTADGVVPVPFQGLSFLVPGGATYRFAMKGTGPGNVRYASAALSANTFSSGGVNVHIGTHQINGFNVGYSGSGTSLTTTPRYWVGGVTFQPDGPCTGAFTDTATAFPASICVGNSAILSASNTSSGLGATYQWQSSTDSIVFTDVAGATTATYSVTPPVTTYYRLIVGCGNDSDTSTVAKVEVIGAVIPAGTYTVGVAPSDYLTLDEALTAINCGGIGGPVTLAMKPGNYTGNFTIGSFAGSSFGLNITSQSFNANDVVFDNGGSGNTFTIDGAENVTLSSITISNPQAPSSASAGVFISNSNAVTVTACTISGNNGSSSSNNRAIYATGSTNVLILSNQISDAYYGIYHVGTASPNFSTGNQYIANTITNCYYYGIYLTNHLGALIDGNQISDFQSNVSAQGIYMSRNQEMTVTNNKIFGNLGIYGIYMANMNAPFTPGGQNLIANNAIIGDFSSATPRAIYGSASSLDTLDAVTVAHNSIEIRSTSTSATSNGALYFTGGTTTTPLWHNITLFNNSIKVVRQTTGTNMAGVYLSNTALSDSLVSDHNLYWLDVTNPAGEYRIGSNNYDLQSWTTFSGLDSNSLVADPIYSSATDLTPLSVSPLRNAGTPLSFVTFDINGFMRDAQPDIGAYEIQLVANDLLAVEISSPASVITGGSPLPVTFRFKNVGTDTLTAATVAYQFGSNPVVTEAFAGSLAPEDTATFTFTANLTVPVGESGLLQVWTADPNGAIDPTPNNDTLSQILCQPLAAGTYTVGGPTSDFASFDLVGEILNCGGIAGPVVLQSQAPAGLTAGSLRLGVVNGTSATNTLTIEGNGDTLLFDQGETPHIVVMDGAKHIRLRNFVLTGTGNLTGILLKDVEDIEIVSTTILLDTTTTSTLAAGIVASGSYTSATTTTSVKDVRIDSCDILGGYYGIRYNGSSATKAENVRITNSTVRDFYLYGIYSIQDEGGLIENNVVSRGNRRTVSTFYGIYNSTGARNQRVSKNIIRDAYSKISTSSTSFTTYGIYYSGAAGDSTEPNLVSNNLLHDIESVTGSCYGLYVTGGNAVRMYHNTVVLKNQESTSGTTYAAYFLGTGNEHELKNNIIYVNRGGTGTKYCIYMSGTNNQPATNNNVLNMMSTAGSTNGIGYFSSGQFTLADWQAVNSGAFDQNSTDADPLFVDTAMNNFEPSNFAVDNIGTDLLAFVPTDLRDTARTNTSDPGVYEFTVTGCLGVQSVALDSVSHDLAVLSWLSASNAWQLEYDTAGFAQGSGTVITTTNLPYTLTGLSPNTTYEVYVRDSCGGTQFSPWSAVFSFTTLRDYDLTVSAVASPENRACADTAMPVIVVVKNQGTLDVNGYSVAVEAAGIATASLTATSTNVVVAGGSDTLLIGTLNLPNTGGILDLTAVVAGTSDVYADNDTLAMPIEISNVPDVIVQTSADTICEGETVQLWLDTAQGVGNVVWMDSAMNVLFAGDTLEVTNLNETTTYYVQGAGGATVNVGPTDTTFGTAASFAGASLNAQSMLIEAFVPVKLTRAKVYVQNSGWLVVMLRDLSGNELDRDSVMVTQNGAAYDPVVVDIDLDIPVGAYRLGALANQTAGGMLRNSTGAAYPYDIPGVFSITGSTFGAAYYYYYYDMEISTGGCETAIESRTIVVQPGITADFSLDSTALPTISVDAAASLNASTYRWDFGDGTTDTGLVATHTYTGNGTFTVQLIAEGDCAPDTITREVTIMGVNVRDLSLTANIGLYPNPNAGVFEVSYTDRGQHPATLKVMDMQGRVVHREQILPQSEAVKVPLKLANLAPGMYHVQINHQEGVLRTKFQVIK